MCNSRSHPNATLSSTPDCLSTKEISGDIKATSMPTVCDEVFDAFCQPSNWLSATEISGRHKQGSVRRSSSHACRDRASAMPCASMGETGVLHRHLDEGVFDAHRPVKAILLLVRVLVHRTRRSEVCGITGGVGIKQVPGRALGAGTESIGVQLVDTGEDLWKHGCHGLCTHWNEGHHCHLSLRDPHAWGNCRARLRRACLSSSHKHLPIGLRM